MRSGAGEKFWELDENGVEVMLANPRWRSILIQGIVDHVTAQILFKRHQTSLASRRSERRPCYSEAASLNTADPKP